MTNTNTGYRNTGDYNTGDYNTGHRNTGHYNTWDYNTGHYNTGDYNTGHYNTGDYNAGSYNTGSYNAGSYNTGSYNTGFFMTTTPETVEVFDGNALVAHTEFIDALPGWLWNVDPTDHDGDMHKAYAAAWQASYQDWDAVEAIPGFDYDVWVEITGIQHPTPEPAAPETIIVDGVEYKKVEA